MTATHTHRLKTNKKTLKRSTPVAIFRNKTSMFCVLLLTGISDSGIILHKLPQKSRHNAIHKIMKTKNLWNEIKILEYECLKSLCSFESCITFDSIYLSIESDPNHFLANYTTAVKRQRKRFYVESINKPRGIWKFKYHSLILSLFKCMLLVQVNFFLCYHFLFFKNLVCFGIELLIAHLITGHMEKTDGKKPEIFQFRVPLTTI